VQNGQFDELTDLTNMARVPTAEPAMETIAAADAKLKLEVLRHEIQKGLDDVKRGTLVSPQRAFAAVDRELRKLSKK